jgi:hypothetical protein
MTSRDTVGALVSEHQASTAMLDHLSGLECVTTPLGGNQFGIALQTEGMAGLTGVKVLSHLAKLGGSAVIINNALITSISAPARCGERGQRVDRARQQRQARAGRRRLGHAGAPGRRAGHQLARAPLHHQQQQQQQQQKQ